MKIAPGMWCYLAQSGRRLEERLEEGVVLLLFVSS